MLWISALLIIRRTKLRNVIAYIVVFFSLAMVIRLTLVERSYIHDICLIPFVTLNNVGGLRSLLMNVALFIPLGLSLPFVLPDRVKRKVLVSTVIGIILSICIEASQYIFSLGRCETDDVIMNTLGTLIGATSYTLYKLLTSWIDKKKVLRDSKEHDGPHK